MGGEVKHARSETLGDKHRAPTLEGQYIVKNLVLISAGLVIGATVRGSAVVADPEIARGARGDDGLAE